MRTPLYYSHLYSWVDQIWPYIYRISSYLYEILNLFRRYRDFLEKYVNNKMKNMGCLYG